jgi:hypothetical protein
VLVGLGATKKSEGDMVRHFLAGLDIARHADMKRALANKTRERPKTLKLACEMAANWK